MTVGDSESAGVASDGFPSDRAQTGTDAAANIGSTISVRADSDEGSPLLSSALPLGIDRTKRRFM